MKTRRIVIVLLLICSFAFAQRGGRSSGSRSSKSSSSSKTVHVREYKRKDGTVVRAHDRRAPGTASATSEVVTPPPTPYRRGHAAAGYAVHPSVHRDSRGRIKRSSAARSAFIREHPCPSTGRSSGRCPGYIVDHVKALECGGADAPTNMQWQTVADAKVKDRSEHLCRQ